MTFTLRYEGLAEAILAMLAIILECATMAEEEIPAGWKRANKEERGKDMDRENYRPARLAVAPRKILS